jgi:hypothetical protein
MSRNNQMTALVRPLLAALFSLGVLAPSLAHAADDPVRRFALVIGSNATLDPEQAALRFADDDAARMTELLVELGADTELVTALDRESQAVYPELVARAHAPDRVGLTDAWDALRGRIDAAEAGGAVTELLIYYSGHGDVGEDGQGYLTLSGDRFTRHDLFQGLLATSPADFHHVLIDACRSEQFVLSRGKGKWKDDRAAEPYGQRVADYLDKTQIGAFATTGVIVAHSVDQQTHEWERYRGGIFTHELLSGLRGGADLNGDGRIEYSEVAAFVSAANHGVSDPRARLDVVARPPVSDERHPLMEHLDLVDERVLVFVAGDTHRYTIEDGRGVRLADVRGSGEQPAYLRLPDGEVFVQREGTDREEVALAASTGGVILAADLPYRPTSRAARGALDQSLRAGLFSTPYGPGYYAGYTARTGMLGVADPTFTGDTWLAAARDPSAPAEAAPQPEAQPELAPPETKPAAQKEAEFWKDPRWGGIFFGTVVTPFDPAGRIRLSPKRVTSNQFRGCLSPFVDEACTALRGFDLRWQYFNAGGKDPYPRFLWHFRTGYHAGRADFLPEDDAVGFTTGQATALGYFSIPLFLGANVYLFDDFPLRPYAGLGFGLDILRLQYERQGEPIRTNVSARIGFELHAGIEARITNHVALTAEIQQLWSARKKLGNVPDFSNTGFTVITGIAAGFKLPDRRGRGRSHTRVKRE